MNADTAYQAALRRLQASLGLPAGDGFTQDWAFELPQELRTADWFMRYRHHFGRTSDDLERRILMELVLDVANDLEAEGLLTSADWREVLRELRRGGELYAGILGYWALDGDELEDCFPLTRLVRRFVRQETA